jgi:hypothetical protein
LSAILTVPVLVPTMVGVKVTLIVQLLAAAKLAGQLFACVKSPVAEICAMLRGTPPPFVTVTL